MCLGVCGGHGAGVRPRIIGADMERASRVGQPKMDSSAKSAVKLVKVTKVCTNGSFALRRLQLEMKLTI